MRAHDTYRSERRNEWRRYHRLYRGVFGAIATWPEFNQPPAEDRHLYGSSLAPYAGAKAGRSVYTPHDGGKRYVIDRHASH
jgi:hypothetical protein